MNSYTSQLENIYPFGLYEKSGEKSTESIINCLDQSEKFAHIINDVIDDCVQGKLKSGVKKG